MYNESKPLPAESNYMGRSFQKIQDSVRKIWNLTILAIIFCILFFCLEFFVNPQMQYDSLKDFSLAYKINHAGSAENGRQNLLEIQTAENIKSAELHPVSAFSFTTSGCWLTIIKYAKFLFISIVLFAVFYQIKLYIDSLSSEKYFSQRLYKSFRNVSTIFRISTIIMFLYLFVGVEDYLINLYFSRLFTINGESFTIYRSSATLPPYILVLISFSAGEIMNVFSVLIKNGLLLQKENDLTV